MRRVVVPAALVPALLLVPERVLACAVCLSGANDDSRRAFFDMTILMTFLPLVLFAVGLGWLAWKARHILASEFEDRDEVAAAAKGRDAGV